jgi:hypothetical protein
MVEVNNRILNVLMPKLKEIGMIEFDTNFCDNIGLLKQNLNNIKNNKMSFNLKHVYNISKVYNVNTNWILGFENNMFKPFKTSAK